MINNVIDKLRIYLFPPVTRRDALEIAAKKISRRPMSRLPVTAGSRLDSTSITSRWSLAGGYRLRGAMVVLNMRFGAVG